MNPESITRLVNEAIRETGSGQVAAAEITAGKKIRDDLGLTSLQYIILALKLEETFGKAIITDANIAQITTTDDLYQAVMEKINNQ